MVDLFCEEDLITFANFWQGDISLVHKNVITEGNKRGITAVAFWLLHHPELFSQLPLFWQKCIKQMINSIRVSIFLYCNGFLSSFRRDDTYNYFNSLYRMWVDYFDEIFIFRFRYQNFKYLSLNQLADMIDMVL